MQFPVLSSKVIEQRLQSYQGDDLQRERTLKGFYQSAGCTAERLSEQPVKGLQQPNVICVLPGRSDSTIVIGAHFDHIRRGDGVVDNWSGASMLPSLYQGLKTQPRQHTFIFVNFSGEEQVLVGSGFFVKHLSREQVDRIEAMVNLDTLGLGPTEVWVSRSDKNLVRALNGVAQALHLPLSGMNVDAVGESDEESFVDRKIPVVTIHSLTQDTVAILHTAKDMYDQIHFNDYFNSYRLLSAYLVFLDQNWDAQKSVAAEKSAQRRGAPRPQ